MKEAYIFDLDDTLIKTNSHIYVYDHSSELVDKINSTQYVRKREVIREYYENGYRVDISEFGGNDSLSYHFLYNGETMQEQMELLRRKAIEENVDIYIVTGRGNHPMTIKDLIYKKFEVSIPTSQIYPVGYQQKMNGILEEMRARERPEIMEMLERGANAANYKKIAFYDILRKGYQEAHFFDDDPENIECFDNLVREMKRLHFSTKTYSYLVI